MKMYIAGNKYPNRISLRSIMSVGHITYVVKGPLGTRFYAAGRYDKQSAVNDYRNALLAR